MITLYVFGRRFGLPDPSPFVSKAEILLKLAGLAYRRDESGYGKAPKGKLPYINDGGTIVADSTFIRAYLETRYGIEFDDGISPEQKAIAWSVEKMCEEHLYFAFLESRWLDDANFNKGPRAYFDQAPAPLRPLVIAMVRRQIRARLKAQGMGAHSRAEIERLGCRDIDAIAAILGGNPWLTGAEPIGADASVWSFVAGALCPFFETPMRTAAERHANLIAYRDRGMQRWFPDVTPTA